mmetsp:Transcript_25948/g.86971  ORF Transcript_25948/g.86971 Transcript_25948/m.86971 type:complete len:200 (+) Transcript_25948:419-1018(+)
MSTWAQGAFSTNSLRKSAAVMEPPARPPTFLRSAMGLFRSSAYSEARGMRQASSPVASAALARLPARPSSAAQTPAYLSPSAMMHAPVSVATSTMASSGVAPSAVPRRSAYTRASARVSRPSASVLITSMVLSLDAVRMSPGRMARSLTMFSQAATRKCASTPAGWRRPTARAAPRTAPAPPMSNFIFSIMEPAPALRL